MGNDLLSYRAAIGLFYIKVYSRIFKKYKFTLFDLSTLFHWFKTCAVSILALTSSDIYRVFVPACLIYILLLISGIEPHPGPNDALAIFQLNIRSLRNKISYLSTLASEYDIICITETHLDASVPNSDLLIDGYNEPLRLDRTAHGGGIAVYISNKLFVTRKPEFDHPYLELLWLEVRYASMSILVCTVYRAPNSAPAFWDHFHMSIEKSSQHH